MILLPVPHFMSQHYGHFVRIIRQAVQPFVDAHDMAHTAKRVKALLFIHKIQVRFLMDGRIHSRNPFGQTGHHFIQLLLAVIILGNTVFFFISFKQLPASFFRLIILNYLINLLRCRRALDNRS